MDELKTLFERAPRLRADEALWNRIERALDAPPGEKKAAAAAPSLLLRFRPAFLSAAAAAAAALAFALLPASGADAEEELWSETLAGLWTEEDSGWDEDSAGDDPAELVISWSDGLRKGDGR